MLPAEDNQVNLFLHKAFREPLELGYERRHPESSMSTSNLVFSCGPNEGRSFLTPGHPGDRVKAVGGISGLKSVS